MQSKRVKQAIALSVDTLIMQGPFTIREAAALARGSIHDSDYSVADLIERDMAWLMRAVKEYATHALSQGDMQTLYSRVPDAFRAAMPEVSRCICSKPGREAEWVGVFEASRDAWKLNMEMKEFIAARTAVSAEDARFIYDLLKFTGKETLGDLLVEAA